MMQIKRITTTTTTEVATNISNSNIAETRKLATTTTKSYNDNNFK